MCKILVRPIFCGIFVWSFVLQLTGSFEKDRGYEGGKQGNEKKKRKKKMQSHVKKVLVDGTQAGLELHIYSIWQKYRKVSYPICS